MSFERRKTWWFILPSKPADRNILGHIVRDLHHIEEVIDTNPGEPICNAIEFHNSLLKERQPLQWENPRQQGHVTPFKDTVENYRDFNALDIFKFHPTVNYISDYVKGAFMSQADRQTSPPVFMVTGQIIARYRVPVQDDCRSSPASSVTLGHEDFPVVYQDFFWAVQLYKIYSDYYPPYIEGDWCNQPRHVKDTSFVTGTRAAFPGASMILDLKETLAGLGFRDPKIMKEFYWPDHLFIVLNADQEKEVKGKDPDTEMADA
ncbi:hypothetical protein QBC43DRAFT_53120 [Cladorrhinum sp. PSN259]|nr:hypothetical protein QBC43DRAFT_53120 [Cladorrhinum sp. PSN259]